MMSFRDFIEADMQAAPSMGQPPAPSSPGGEPAKPGNNDVRTGWHEFGIDDEDGEEAMIHGEPLMSFDPLRFPNSPISASAPMPISMDKDGKATVMYSVMNKSKMMNPNGSKYHGPVKDMQVHLGNRNRKDRKSLSYDDIWLRPFSMAQQTGGMPPGGPPGGGMGGPPGGPPGGM